VPFSPSRDQSKKYSSRPILPSKLADKLPPRNLFAGCPRETQGEPFARQRNPSQLRVEQVPPARAPISTAPNQINPRGDEGSKYTYPSLSTAHSSNTLFENKGPTLAAYARHSPSPTTLSQELSL
jgi:hypothetical protein